MLHSGWYDRMMMLVLLLLTALATYSQGIAVEKFEAAPEDLTANLQGTQVLDQNGDVCALIRIQTTQKGFVFDVGVLGITKTDDNKVGEIWVYVPKGVKRITIRHPQLGSLVNYPFPIEIQGARTYRMYLTTGQVHTIIEQDDGMTYFALNVTPAKAVVMIDGVLQPLDDDGALTLRLARGPHTLAIQAPGYDAYSTTFDLGKERMAKEVVLVSALAHLSLNCATPGVGLYVNDQFKANGSWNGDLMPGDYLIEARKEGHYTQKQSVTLAAKEKKTIDLPALTARTGNLDVNYKPINCEVFLDGTRLGISPDMFKNIIMGKHKIKISKAGYTTKEVTIDISEGQTATLTGSLEKVVAQNYPNQGGSNASLVSNSSNKTFTVKGVTFTMVAVEGGTFMMGATSEQGRDAYSNEKPVHHVTLSNYYIGQTEVTQALWKAVMGTTVSEQRDKADTSLPLSGEGDNFPMYYISWEECQTFVSKLNQLTGKRFRLPTEAEWEYACRGGKKSRGYKYSGSNTIDDVAWYTSNSSFKTHSVGTKSPNELGIYDMSGNVDEWCQDWYGSYSSAAQTNPTGASSGSNCVFRGGSRLNNAKYCRSSYRYGFSPGSRNDFLGLRLVLSE
ncbi:MAG: SUMF1/EgtB/PvdO family nonheme iron enzyme [Prevotellaceae bacterium]|nr:SUMF1/EgtB/PvdO family nonheme iron enzyme [Prevotellaceae bacterium]